MKSNILNNFRILKFGSAGLLLVFVFNTCCYGLAPLVASQNPEVKRAVLASFARRMVRHANSREETELLANNNTPCLLLSSGVYLVTNDVAEDAIELLSSLYHQDIKAMMQILREDDLYRYGVIKDVIQRQFPYDGRGQESAYRHVDHIVARAFQWLLLENEGLIERKDIPADEAEFLARVEPMIIQLNYIFRENGFWDSSDRKKAFGYKGSRAHRIEKARSAGMRFYEVSERVYDPKSDECRYDDVLSAYYDRFGGGLEANIERIHAKVDEIETELREVNPEYGSRVRSDIGEFLSILLGYENVGLMVMDEEHGILHALDDFLKSLEIIKLEDTELRGQIEWKVLLASAMMHDIAAVVERKNHSEAAGKVIKQLLEPAQVYDDRFISKVMDVVKAHGDKEKWRHIHDKYVEARVLSDADTLAIALDTNRGLRIAARNIAEKDGKFFDPDIPMETRENVLLRDLPREDPSYDALVYLLYQVLIKGSEGYQVMEGAKEYIRRMGEDRVDTAVEAIKKEAKKYLDDETLKKAIAVIDELVEFVRVEYAKANVVGSIGGTKIAISAVYTDGTLVEMRPEFVWCDRFGVGSSEEDADEFAAKLTEEIIGVIDEVGYKKVGKVGISIKGDVDVVDGVKYLGPGRKMTALPLKDYPLEDKIKEVLSAKYGKVIQVDILNDGSAAILGEVSREGTFEGLRDACCVIIGTGIGFGAVKNGKLYSRAEMRRDHGFAKGISGLGRYLVYVPKNGGYVYENRLPVTRGEMPAVLEKGEEHFTDRLAGPGLARRFARVVLDDPALMSEVGISRDRLEKYLEVCDGKEKKGVVEQENLVESKVVEKALLVEVTKQARVNNGPAKKFVAAVATELGRALAEFMYLLKDEKFLEHAALVSSVAENFAIGVKGHNTDDLFIENARKAAERSLREKGLSSEKAEKLSGGICRSNMSHEREYLAFMPSDKDRLLTKGKTLRETLRGLKDEGALTVGNCTQMAEDAAELFMRYHELTGEPLMDAIDAIIDIAVLPDQKLAVASKSLLSNIVTNLKDSYKMAARDMYYEFYSHVIQEYRKADPKVDELLSRFNIPQGMDGEDMLCDRISEHKVPRRFAGDPAGIKKVFLFSRVSLGADIALNSMVSEAARKRFPNLDEVVFFGSKAGDEMFGGTGGMRVRVVSYERRGDVKRDIHNWVNTVDAIDAEIREAGLKEGEYILVDVDSRVTRFGLLPLVDRDAERGYSFFFNSIMTEKEIEDKVSLSTSLNRWLNEVFPWGEDALDEAPVLYLRDEDEQFAEGFFSNIPEGKYPVAVNYGVGGNDEKRINDEFEKDLVSRLLRMDKKVSVVLFTTDDEKENARVKSIAESMGEKGYDVKYVDKKSDAVALREAGEARLIVVNVSLGRFAALVKRCRQYVGYDSMGQHAAAALNVPCVTAFAGYIVPYFPDRWRPGGKGRILTTEIDNLHISEKEVRKRQVRVLGEITDEVREGVGAEKIGKAGPMVRRMLLSAISSAGEVGDMLFSAMKNHKNLKSKLRVVVYNMLTKRDELYTDLDYVTERKKWFGREMGRINSIIKEIQGGENESKVEIEDRIPEWIDECLQLLYSKTRDEFFEKFYTGKGVELSGHAFAHALNDLEWSLMIIANTSDPEEIRENRDMTEVDYKALVYATLLHDLSNVVARDIHSIASSYLIGCLLEGEEEIFSAADADKVMFIANAHYGGEVKKTFGKKIYEEYYPANILKDADTLDNGLSIERVNDINAERFESDSKYTNQKWFDGKIKDKERVDHLNKTRKLESSSDRVQYLMDSGFNHRIPGYYQTDGARNLVLAGMDLIGENGPFLTMPGYFKTDGNGRRSPSGMGKCKGVPVLTGILETLFCFFDKADARFIRNGKMGFTEKRKDKFRETCYYVYERSVLRRIFADAGVDYLKHFDGKRFPNIYQRIDTARALIDEVIGRSGGDYRVFNDLLESYTIKALLVHDIQEKIDSAAADGKKTLNVFIGGLGENLGLAGPNDVETAYIDEVLTMLMKAGVHIYMSDRMASTPFFVLERYLELRAAKIGEGSGCRVTLVGSRKPGVALSARRFTEIINQEKLPRERVQRFFCQLGLDYDESISGRTGNIIDALGLNGVNYVRHTTADRTSYDKEGFTSRFRGSRRSSWVIREKLSQPDDFVIWMSPAKTGVDSRACDTAVDKGLEVFLFNSRIPDRDVVGRRVTHRGVATVEHAATIKEYIEDMPMMDNTVRILRFVSKGRLEVNTVERVDGLERFDGLTGEDRQRFEENKGKGMFFASGDTHGTTVNFTTMLQVFWDQVKKGLLILGDSFDRGPAWVDPSIWKKDKTVSDSDSLVGNHDLWVMLAAMGRPDYIAHTLLHAFRYGESATETMERELGVSKETVDAFKKAADEAYGEKDFIDTEKDKGNIVERGPKTKAELAALMIYLVSLDGIDSSQFDQFFSYGEENDIPFKYLKPLLLEEHQGITDLEGLRNAIAAAGGDALDILEPKWGGWMRDMAGQISSTGKGKNIIERVLGFDLYRKTERDGQGYPGMLLMHTLPLAMDDEGRIEWGYPQLAAAQEYWVRLRYLYGKTRTVAEQAEYDSLIEWVHTKLSMGLDAVLYMKQKDFPGFSFYGTSEDDNWIYQFLGIKNQDIGGETVSKKAIEDKARSNLFEVFGVVLSDYVEFEGKYYIKASGSRKIADKMAEDCGVDLFVGGHVSEVGVFADRIILQDPVYARKSGAGGFEDHGSALVVLADGSMYQLMHRSFFDLITDPRTKERMNEAIKHHVRLTEMAYYKWALNWEQMSMYPLLMEQVLDIFGRKVSYGQEDIVLEESEFRDILMEKGGYFETKIDADSRVGNIYELMATGKTTVNEKQDDGGVKRKTITFIDVLKAQAGIRSLRWKEFTGRFAPLRVCTPARITKVDLDLFREDATEHDEYYVDEFKALRIDVLDKYLKEDVSYVIKYDSSRLSASQAAIIEQYAKILDEKTDCKVRARGCASSMGSKDKLITVLRKGISGDVIGMGQVDVDLPEGKSVERIMLRITGMVNLALAECHLSKEADADNGPILGFIMRQCRMIVGVGVVVPDEFKKLVAFLKKLPLLPASKMPLEKIEEHNELARKALVAA